LVSGPTGDSEEPDRRRQEGGVGSPRAIKGGSAVDTLIAAV